MNTAFLLMAQYGGRAIIPLEEVARDYFPHIELPKLIRKLSAGDIKLAVVRIEASQKAAKGIALTELARYLDERIDAANRELEQLTR